MEGDLGAETPHPHAGGLEARSERLDLRGLPGEHRLVRSVDGRDRERRALLDHRAQGVDRHGRRGHRAAGRELRHGRPPSTRELHRLGGGQRARDGGRRDLAEGVAEDGLGPDSEVGEPIGERERERGERGLGEPRVVDARVILEQHGAQVRRVEQLSGDRVDELVEDGAEAAVRLREARGHGSALAPLARDEEPDGQRARRVHLASVHGGEQLLAESRRLGGHGRDPMTASGATVGKHGRHVAGLGRLERRPDVTPHLLERLGMVSAHEEQLHGEPGERVPHRGLGRHEDDVGVRPRESEAAHRGRWSSLRPRLESTREHDPLVDGHGRVEPLEVERAGNPLVVHGENRLDERRDARGGLEVPDLALDRPDEERLAPWSPVDRLHGPDLHGVTERRAGSVSLEHADIPGRERRGVERPTEHRLLCGSTGDRETRAVPVVADRRPRDDGPDAVPVRKRVGEALEHDDPAPLTPDVARSPRIERPDLTRLRQRPDLLEVAVALGRQQQVDASGEGHRGLPSPEGLGREVHRDQRRAAGRVDRQRRPRPAEVPSEPTRGEAGLVARARPGEDRLHVGPSRVETAPVLGAPDAHEHRTPSPLEPRRGDPGVLERLLGDLEQQALLGIESGSLGGDHPESGRIEIADLVEVASGRAVIADLAPGRGRPYRILAAGEERPELGGVRCSRKTKRETDDRHLLVRDGGRGGHVGLAPETELGEEVSGEGVHARMIEGDRRRDAEAGDRPNALGEVDGEHGVHPELEEAGARIHRIVEPEHLAHERRELADELGTSQLGRRLLQLVDPSSGSGGGSGPQGTDPVEEGPRPTRLEHRCEHVPVHIGDDDLRLGLVIDGGGDGGEQNVVGQRPNADARELDEIGLGSDAAERQRAERERDTRQSLLPAAPGQSVQRPIGSGVGREALTAPHRGHRADQDEELERLTRGQRSEHLGPHHLRAERCQKLLVGELAERPRRCTAGCVNDAADRPHAHLERNEHGVGIGDVGPWGLDPRPAVAEARERYRDGIVTCGGRSTTREQHQVPSAEIHELARHEEPELSQTTGDHVPAVGVQRGECGILGQGGHEAGHRPPRPPQNHEILVVTGLDGGEQLGRGGLGRDAGREPNDAGKALRLFGDHRGPEARESLRDEVVGLPTPHHPQPGHPRVAEQAAHERHRRREGLGAASNAVGEVLGLVERLRHEGDDLEGPGLVGERRIAGRVVPHVIELALEHSPDALGIAHHDVPRGLGHGLGARGRPFPGVAVARDRDAAGSPQRRLRHPEGLSLKGVWRQVGRPDVREQGPEVRPRALSDERRHGLEQAGAVGLVGLEPAEPGGARDHPPAEQPEDPLGADLDEHLVVLGRRSAHRVDETDGGANVGDPVLHRGHRLGRRTGEGAEHGNSRLVKSNVREASPHLGEDGLHQGRVEGVGDRERPRVDVGCVESRHQGLDVGVTSRDDRLVGAVEGSHVDHRPGGKRRDRLAHPFFRSPDRGHASPGGEPRHGAAAGDGKGDRPLEVEHASHQRRRDLADAVAHHGVGSDPEGGPGAGQRVAEPHDGRLRVARVAKPLGIVAVHHGEQGLARHGQVNRLDLVEGRPVHLGGLVEGLAHPGILAALAGEREHEGRVALGLDGLDPFGQGRRIVDDEGDAVALVRLREARRPGDGGQ